jgi:hypothetical protein
MQQLTVMKQVKVIAAFEKPLWLCIFKIVTWQISLKQNFSLRSFQPKYDTHN